MMGKDVIDNMCWDIKKQNLLFSDLIILYILPLEFQSHI